MSIEPDNTYEQQAAAAQSVAATAISVLNDRLGELSTQANIESVAEYDTLSALLQRDFAAYYAAARFADEMLFRRVVDIGCGYGHQAELFKGFNIDYFGVDPVAKNMWAQDYTIDSYPCSLPKRILEPQVGLLGIVRHRLDCNVDVCKALSLDFDNVLVAAGGEPAKKLAAYYKGAEPIQIPESDDSWLWLSGSLLMGGGPLNIRMRQQKRHALGILAKYADPAKISQEADAMRLAMADKFGLQD